MKRPSLDDLELAALWLEYNEGENGESDACARVAAWLREQVHASQERSVARAHHVPVKLLRQKLPKGSPVNL